MEEFMEYTGYRQLYLDENQLSDFYSTKKLPFGLKNNEYLIIEDDKGKAIDYYCNHNGTIEKVFFPEIGNVYTGIMKPRNPQQYCALDLLKNDDIAIKLLTGTWGSGKSMACITAALEAVEKGKFERIIFIRNNVQVKDTDNLGALPGTADDKMSPYLAPFADHCGGMEGICQLVEAGKLEVIPLGFLRGRSIKNSILYSMESENLTKEHIQLIMGRIDEGSQLWMDGDLKQRDRISFEKSQGLEIMIERLQDEPLFGYVHMPKSERSPVASLADKLN
jgi:PhoH-like ATPase